MDNPGLKPLCVIPVYNNAGTLARVVRECRARMPDVLVVDDGSTDADIPVLAEGEGARVIRHPVNCGKGAALQSALAYAKDKGFSHLITLDADGQHDPAALPLFLEAIARAPEAVVIGVRDFSVPHVPGSSRFGRIFSNCWVYVETGVWCADTQSGYRAYPVALLAHLSFSGRRFDFEIEVIVRAFWAGLPLVEVPIVAWYAPRGERITHFSKGRDNLLLVHAHGKLMSRRLLPWPHRRLVRSGQEPLWKQMAHPVRCIKALLRENATPGGLGLSAAVGTFLAVLPIPGFHTTSILMVTTVFRLNRVMALAIQNLFIPPFTPLLCISVGHFMLQGVWIPRLSLEKAELMGYLKEWAVGSLLIAPALALFFGLLVQRVALIVRARAVPLPAITPVNRRGNALGFWFFRTALKWTGLRGAYGLLYFVCAYYAIFDRIAVGGALAYVKRLDPRASFWRTRLAVYRLFICQGKCLIDRHAFNAGVCAFTFDNRFRPDLFGDLQSTGKGFILLLAHVGGWQLALPYLKNLSKDRPVSLLMREAETHDVRTHVRGDDAGFHLISPEAGPACVIEMVARLERGEIVSIMGDRAYGGQAAPALFLGEDAFFPVSAFSVARAAQCPVVALFFPKTGLFDYRIEPIRLTPPSLERKNEVRCGVQAFASALEDFCRRHPDQCFLFHDIWRKDGELGVKSSQKGEFKPFG